MLIKVIKKTETDRLGYKREYQTRVYDGYDSALHAVKLMTGWKREWRVEREDRHTTYSSDDLIANKYDKSKDCYVSQFTVYRIPSRPKPFQLPRDSQRQKAYNWEGSLKRKKMPMLPRVSVLDAQQIADALWTASRFPHAAPMVEKGKSLGASTAYGTYKIVMSPDMMSVDYLAHEFAHSMIHKYEDLGGERCSGHGPEFMRFNIQIKSLFIPELNQRQLVADARKFGLKVAPMPVYNKIMARLEKGQNS